MSLSIEALAAKGIHLVQHIEGEFARFEQIVASGTKVFEGNSLEEAQANVEASLAQHAGALGTDISRSDGASESLDVQVQHSAQVGPSDLPTPAADEAAAAPAPEAEPAEIAAAPAAEPAEAPAEDSTAAEGEQPAAPAEPVVES